MGTGLERPDHRREGSREHQDEQAEREADAREIGKFVTTRSIHHEVGLVADRSQEAGRRDQSHTMAKGRGSTPRLTAVATASGNMSAAAAVLVTISVKSIVKTAMPASTA